MVAAWMPTLTACAEAYLYLWLQVEVPKGFTIEQFLNKCREQIPQLRSAAADQIIYVKEDLIMPHSVTFYELIVNKAPALLTARCLVLTDYSPLTAHLLVLHRRDHTGPAPFPTSQKSTPYTHAGPVQG